MSRWVCRAASVDRCRALIDALRGRGVDDDAMTVIGGEGVSLDALPDSVTDDEQLVESDVLPGVQRGIAYGGATGLLAGLAVVATGSLGVVAAGAGAAVATTALTTTGGASLGAFVSAVVGSSVPNSELREFEEALGRSELLVIVDETAIARDQLQLVAESIDGVSVMGDTSGPPPAV